MPCVRSPKGVPMRCRAQLVLIAASAVLGGAAPSAAADGLPVPVDQTYGAGVVSADGHSRFVALPAGERTLVMRISTADGEVTSSTVATDDYTVPAIAVDGTASGISANGETLALINPRQTFPRSTTSFRIYDAEKLRRDPLELELQGDFSFDALSPDGETMYLIEYTDPRDPGAYQVRSFDLATRKLEPDPLLDSEEDPDEMRGLPMTRATSLDGGWEYTLYDGGGAHPFIHALDVVEGTTVCIDLDMLKPKETFGASLESTADGSAIELTDQNGELRAIVDTHSQTALEPSEQPEPTAAPTEPKDSGLETAGIAAGAVIFMALVGVGIRRMRR